MSDPLTVGSLFSGVGMIELGLERAGCKVIWQAEIDPQALMVLARHWPGVPNLGDVEKIDWRNVERPDIICGGFPCQPFSLAGVSKKNSLGRKHGFEDVRQGNLFFSIGVGQ